MKAWGIPSFSVQNAGWRLEHSEMPPHPVHRRISASRVAHAAPPAKKRPREASLHPVVFSPIFAAVLEQNCRLPDAVRTPRRVPSVDDAARYGLVSERGGIPHVQTVPHPSPRMWSSSPQCSDRPTNRVFIERGKTVSPPRPRLHRQGTGETRQRSAFPVLQDWRWAEVEKEQPVGSRQRRNGCREDGCGSCGRIPSLWSHRQGRRERRRRNG